jgi:hypothetical protein
LTERYKPVQSVSTGKYPLTVIPQGEPVTEVSTVSAPQTASIAPPDPPVDSASEVAGRYRSNDCIKPSAATPGGSFHGSVGINFSLAR